MASQAFYQACQDGDIAELREQLSTIESLEVNSKDGYGMTALAYAARNGHTEVVKELLSRGAHRAEVLEQGYGKDHPEIAPLLESSADAHDTLPNSEADKSSQQGAVPLHLMADGSYPNGGPYLQHGYPMMNAFGPGFPTQQYHYDGGAQGGPGRKSAQPPQGHARKDSNANLPPPDVARMIPCKFFPNCRYGDRCMFAHPIMSVPPALHPDGTPVSPSMSSPPPHMQPIFYQPMPTGYPYPAPYATGPHFYPPMGPPNVMHQHQQIQSQQQSSHQAYVPANQFTPPVVPQQYQQQSLHNGLKQDSSSSASAGLAVDGEEGTAKETSSAAAAPLDEPNATSKDEAGQLFLDEQSKERGATSTPPQQDGDASEPALEQSKEAMMDETAGKTTHRRQSFNSFLHHHAIPFQPTALQSHAGTDMAMMSGAAATPMLNYVPNRMGSKNKRVPGAMGGFGKRINGERPACTFFANGRCRFGDECHFPHILQDGSDARPLQAQQRQAQTALRGGAASTGDGAPKSAPTGPQAEKKAAPMPSAATNANGGEKQPGFSQEGSGQQQHSKATAGNQTAGGPGVVRSNPSKTSTQAAAAASRGHQNGAGTSSGSKKHAAHQPTQRVPTVNDFPALAGASPNFSNGPSTSTATQVNGQVHQTHSEAQDGSKETAAAAPAIPENISSNSHSAAPRANFSAILSAPAPVKARALSADASNDKHSDAGEEPANVDSSSAEVVKANGEEKTSKALSKANGAGNAANREVKPKGKDAPLRQAKGESYKSMAAVTANKILPNQDGDDDGDFQLVHRSRAANKRSPSVNPRPAGTADSYAAQAKAVAA